MKRASVGTGTSALGTALSLVTEKVSGRRLARRLAGQSVPSTPVAVYFADAPASLHQLRRWYRPLKALNDIHPTVIVTSVPATYERVLKESGLPVAFASGAPALTRAVASRGIRVILYVNHNALNFRVLRFPEPVHVFIGHGESVKESSVSRQLKAYDFTFIADDSARERLRTIRGYDPDTAAITGGAPWLDFLPAAPESWQPDDRTVVFYAPTWEGDRPTMGYGSVESHGEAIVAALLAEPRFRLIYRPHPWLGRVRAASREADARIRAAITRANRDDVIDTGEYGWPLAVADVCIADVSSVAFDWAMTGKLMLVTEVPNESTASALHAAGTITLTVADAARVVSIIHSALATGDQERGTEAPADPGRQTQLFIEAVTRMIEASGLTTW